MQRGCVGDVEKEARNQLNIKSEFHYTGSGSPGMGPAVRLAKPEGWRDRSDQSAVHASRTCIRGSGVT